MKESINEIWSAYIKLQEKKLHRKIMQKLQPEN